MEFKSGRNLIQILREHLVVGSLFSAAIVVGLSWFLVTSPELQQAQELAMQKQALEQRVAFLKRFSQQGDYDFYERTLAQELKEAESMLEQSPDLNRLSQIIYRLADEQELRVEFIRLPNEEMVKRHKTLPVKILPIQISLQGDYSDLVSFIRKTESKYILHRLELDGHVDGSVEAELEIHVPCLV